MSEDTHGIRARLFTTLNHPVRVQLLNEFHRGETSPSEAAARLDLPLPNVIHHVTRLVREGHIELTERRMKRGAVEHRYRLVRPAWLNGGLDRLASPPAGAPIERPMNEIFEDVVEATRASVFERDLDFHVLRRPPVDLDEEGWRELDERLQRFVAEARQIEREATARHLRDPIVRRVSACLAVLRFQTQDPKRAD